MEKIVQDIKYILVSRIQEQTFGLTVYQRRILNVVMYWKISFLRIISVSNVHQRHFLLVQHVKLVNFLVWNASILQTSVYLVSMMKTGIYKEIYVSNVIQLVRVSILKIIFVMLFGRTKMRNGTLSGEMREQINGTQLLMMVSGLKVMVI